MKIFLLVIGAFCFITSQSQITTTKVAVLTSSEKKYDSTENFLADNPKLYIGQELYVLGISETLRGWGYPYFILDYTAIGSNQKNVYKPDSLGINSKYEELAGKYFTVLDVLRDPIISSNCYLKLQEKGGTGIAYFNFQPQFPTAFPFLVTGYYIKAKQNFVGKKFVVKGLNWYTNEISPPDMKTGVPVSEFERGNIWEVVDFTVEERFYKLSLILENSKHQQLPIGVDNLKDTYWAWDYDKIVASGIQPGDKNWTALLSDLVIKGMTKDMCEASWGKPENIITTKGTGDMVLELWTYKSDKVYFTNGVVTSTR